MKSRRLTPAERMLASVGATYLAVAVFAVAGGWVASLFPCSGKFCELNQMIGGALAGAGIAVLVVGLLATAKWGMRWWFLPVLLLTVVAGFALAVATGQPAGWLAVLLAPVIAGVVSAGFRTRSVAIGLVTVAVIVGLGAAYFTLRDHQQAQARREARAQQFRASDVPLYAPVERDDAVIRLVHADVTVTYDLRVPERDGWLRVILRPSEPCNWNNHTEVGDDIIALGTEDLPNACRALGGGSAEVGPDGGRKGWDREAVIEMTRLLEPVDAEWLIERAGDQ